MNQDPDSQVMTSDITTIVSVHGGHRKRDRQLSPEAHLAMLETAVSRLPGPVIISCVGPWVGSKGSLAGHHWIHSDSDLGHQHGAFTAIEQGLWAARTKWIFVTAEDVLFESQTPAQYAVNQAITEGVDYLSRPWFDDNSGIGTQVFAARVAPLCASQVGKHAFSFAAFAALDANLEHYMLATLRDHGIPFSTMLDVPAWSSHDPTEFIRKTATMLPRSQHLKRVLIKFRHGLGDAVQLTSVLLHLRSERPGWLIDVAAQTGKHTCYRGLCERSYDMDREPVPPDHTYDAVFDLEWKENTLNYADTISTKVTRCLAEVFGIESKRELLRYEIQTTPEEDWRAVAWLESIGCTRIDDGRFNGVLVHYQGNTSKEKKDLDDQAAGEIVHSVAGSGYIPIILDWDNRSSLPDGHRCFSPSAHNPLWPDRQTGDAAMLAALIERCSALIGVDSGPLHVACATSTPVIGVWTGHSPRRYIEPCGNAIHLVPIDDNLSEFGYRWKKVKKAQIPSEVCAQLSALGIAVAYQPQGQKLRATEYTEDYYKEHKSAGLDYLGFGDWQINYARWLVDTLGWRGKKVLDLGCACGAVVRGFGDAKAVVCGADISEYMINLGRKNWPDMARLLTVADAASLPYDDDSFDAIHCAQSAEHWQPEDVPAILQEVFRVLRPGGLFWCALDTEELYARQGRDPATEDPTHFCIKPIGWWHERLIEVGLIDVTQSLDRPLREANGSYLKEYDWDWFAVRKPEAEIPNDSSDRQKLAQRKIILGSNLSPGDIVVMTAAVRDLHTTYPGQFLTDVRTPCQALWEHNPHITPIPDGEGELIELNYPSIHESNQRPRHFIEAYREDLERQLGRPIKQGAFKGDIHLGEAERSWMSQVEEVEGVGARFWIIVSGGKSDFTAKHYAPDRLQKVVDYFQGKIRFVQVGEKSHMHPPLSGVLDLRGKTDLRQLIRLVHHADGVLCPVTSLMHLAAAVPVREGHHNRPPIRACVVIAGGREPSHWERYTGHRYLDTIGALPCCASGGCWKSRVIPLGDGAEHDNSLCERPVKQDSGQYLPRCLDLITADDIIRAIDSYRTVTEPAPVVEVPKPKPAREFFDSNGNKVQILKTLYFTADGNARVMHDRMVKEGPGLWRELHLKALGTTDHNEFNAWLDEFKIKLACGECRQHFGNLRREVPLTRDLFEWTVEVHNRVNQKLGKPILTLAEAEGVY